MFHCFNLYNIWPLHIYEDIPVYIFLYTYLPKQDLNKKGVSARSDLTNWTGSWPGRRFWLHIFSVEGNQIWLFYHLNDNCYSFKCNDWNPISLVETCQTWKKAQIYSSGSSINPADWEEELTWRQTWTQSPYRTLGDVLTDALTQVMDSPVHGNRCASFIIIPGGGHIGSAQIGGVNSPCCLYGQEMSHSRVEMRAEEI